jgi:hypothetical protein
LDPGFLAKGSMVGQKDDFTRGTDHRLFHGDFRNGMVGETKIKCNAADRQE